MSGVIISHFQLESPCKTLGGVLFWKRSTEWCNYLAILQSGQSLPFALRCIAMQSREWRATWSSAAVERSCMFWRTTAVQSTERVAVEERSEEKRLSARVENDCSSEQERVRDNCSWQSSCTALQMLCNRRSAVLHQYWRLAWFLKVSDAQCYKGIR